MSFVARARCPPLWVDSHRFVVDSSKVVSLRLIRAYDANFGVKLSKPINLHVMIELNAFSPRVVVVGAQPKEVGASPWA